MVAKSADEARAQAAAAQAKATADKAAAAKAEAAKTEAAKVAAAKKAAADKKAAAKTAEEKKAAAEEEAEAKRKEDAYIASFENPITSQYDPRIYENAGLDPERVGVMTSNVTINNAATDPAAIAKAQAEQEGVETAYKYGISEALFNDPEYGDELKAVYTLFKAGNTGKALEELFKTKYYTTLNATVKKRMKERLEQPDVYKDSLDKYKVASRKRLVDAGIKIKMTDFDKLASQAYERGLDDNQFDELIKFSGKITGFGGDILGDTSDLKTYANSFGVSKYLGQAYWDQKSKDLFTGTNTLEDIQAEIRATAASAFPGYADQIKNGMSVESIASAYKGAMANVLERDADSITFEDQTLRSALQYVGPDGKPAIKPLWQFEKELRSKPEWEYTNNARDTIDSLSLKVLRDWGLA